MERLAGVIAELQKRENTTIPTKLANFVIFLARDKEWRNNQPKRYVMALYEYALDKQIQERRYADLVYRRAIVD